MSKILVTLDVSKFDKAKIVDTVFKTQAGVEVKRKEYKVEVVELKQKKLISSGPSWQMFKTHFVAEAQNKDERASKLQTVYVGEGFTFEDKGKPSVDVGVEENPSIDDIPF